MYSSRSLYRPWHGTHFQPEGVFILSFFTDSFPSSFQSSSSELSEAGWKSGEEAAGHEGDSCVGVRALWLCRKEYKSHWKTLQLCNITSYESFALKKKGKMSKIVANYKKNNFVIDTSKALIIYDTNMPLPCNGREVSSSEKTTWCTLDIYTRAPSD